MLALGMRLLIYGLKAKLTLDLALAALGRLAVMDIRLFQLNGINGCTCVRVFCLWAFALCVSSLQICTCLHVATFGF